MIELFTAASLVAALVIGGALMSGYARVLRIHDGGVAVHMAQSICWLIGAYLMRSAWWDGLWFVFGGGDSALAGIFQALGIGWNFFPNVAFTLGCYHGLCAMYLMIPDEDRHEYRWWNAFAYPPWSLLRVPQRLLRKMRGLRRD